MNDSSGPCRLLALAILAALAALASLAAPAAPAQERAATAERSEATAEPAVVHARALSRAFRQAALETSPAVVTIVGKVKSPGGGGRNGLPDLLRDPRFRQLFPEGPPAQEPGAEGDEGGEALDSSLGSGVIIDKSGLVLTNNHVVQDVDEVLVRLSDGRELIAKEVRSDPDSDIAVVRIEGEDLPVARLGDAAKMEIGDWVIAIGSPFELELTVSAGIISGKGRAISKIRRGRLLQTDAAINPGNSGGPLVNLDGEVVGINTAIASSSGGFQGIGFAIPISRAQWVARELIEHNTVRRAYIGVRIASIEPEDARRLAVPIRSGARVVNVIPGSPAADAGLKADDVIVAFDGEAVRGPGELQDLVEQQPLETRHEVEVVREGKRQTLHVTLRPLP